MKKFTFFNECQDDFVLLALYFKYKNYTYTIITCNCYVVISDNFYVNKFEKNITSSLIFIKKFFFRKTSFRKLALEKLESAL